MNRRVLALMTALCLLLGGCSWRDGNYVSIKQHQQQLSGTQSGSLTAANYQQLRQVLSGLVEAGTESAVIHVAEYQQDLVEKGMETGVHYICDLLPLGAYAVNDVTYEIGTVGGQPAISVTISYIIIYVGLHIKEEVHDVAILYDILLTFNSELSSGPACGF